MIRKAQIKKAALEYADTELIGIIDFKKEAAFIEGAEWADRTMIDKACEWIHTAIYLDYERSIEHRYATLEDLLNDFKKAMKGD